MSALYDEAREGFLEGAINWLTNDIKVVLVDDNDYTVDLVNDKFLTAIPSGARVSTSANLDGKTNTSGVADANDVVLPSVSGDEAESLVIYQDTGAEATSRLIAYINTGSGLPVTPDGNNVTIAWSNGADKIFKL